VFLLAPHTLTLALTQLPLLDNCKRFLQLTLSAQSPKSLLKHYPHHNQ